MIAFPVGAAVVSLIIHTATFEKSCDYAVLKALGASNRRLYLVVLSQSFAVGAAGFGRAHRAPFVASVDRVQAVSHRQNLPARPGASARHMSRSAMAQPNTTWAIRMYPATLSTRSS